MGQGKFSIIICKESRTLADIFDGRRSLLAIALSGMIYIFEDLKGDDDEKE